MNGESSVEVAGRGLRRWISGDGLRAIARATGMDRKTIAVSVRAALAAGAQRGGACRPPPATAVSGISSFVPVSVRREPGSSPPDRTARMVFASASSELHSSSGLALPGGLTRRSPGRALWRFLD
jgi:hypothetical protein